MEEENGRVDFQALGIAEGHDMADMAPLDSAKGVSWIWAAW